MKVNFRHSSDAVQILSTLMLLDTVEWLLMTVLLLVMMFDTCLTLITVLMVQV